MVGKIVFLRASEEHVLVTKVNFFPLYIHFLSYVFEGLGGTVGVAYSNIALGFKGKECRSSHAVV